MQVEDISTKEEITFCVNMYIKQNDFSFLNVDKKKAFDNLDLAVRRRKFVKTLKRDKEIVAWIYADVLNSLHMSNRGLQQVYYSSSLSGAAAYRAIKILHTELVNHAVKEKYELVVSPGSHMDETNIFPKILEKLGWQRRGHIAIYKTIYYEPQVV
jgi:hypothetical protein